MTEVLVTGCEGFVGSGLRRELVQAGYSVTGFDVAGLSEPQWRTALEGLLKSHKFDAVFHVGANANTLETNVQRIMQENYLATKMLVDSCVSNACPLIFSSSAAIYGSSGSQPENLYAWTKLVAEDYVVSNGGIALRYFNVYGPGEAGKHKMASVFFQAFQRHKAGEQVQLFPGSPKRDFIFIQDVVSANLLAWKTFSACKGKHFEVGTGSARSFEDGLKLMEIPFSYTEEWLIPPGYQFLTRSNQDCWLPGWRPSFTLEGGLAVYRRFLENLEAGR